MIIKLFPAFLLFFFFSTASAYSQEQEDSCAVYIPNTFTTEGDCFDCNRITVISTCGFLEFHFMLYNRWGEIIFESTDPKMDYDPGHQKEGQYLWNLTGKFDSGREIDFTGVITLVK